MDRVYNSVKRREDRLIPAIPVCVALAGSSIERRPAPALSGRDVDSEAICPERIADIVKLTNWMLETHEMLSQDGDE